MPDRRRRTVLTVLVLISLVLVTLDYRGADSGPIAALQRGAGTVFGPLQDGLATVVRPVGDVLGSIGSLGSLRAQNDRLRSDLDEARTALQVQADLERRIADLEAQLGFAERYELTTTAADVIAAPTRAAFDYSVLIDAGTDAGIRPGMAVVNAAGLVGRVTAADPRTARVQLITTGGAGLVVQIAETRARGLLTGAGPEPFSLDLDDPDAEVADGQSVVTYPFEGSSIPGGLPVGVIDGAGPDPRYRFVRPFVDFARLGVVQVVLDAPEQPAELDPDQTYVQDPEAGRPDSPDEPPDPP